MTFGQLKSLLEAGPSVYTQMRAATNPANVRKMKQLAQRGANRGAVLAGAGLKPSTAAGAERAIAGGRKLNPQLAQRIARAALQG